METIRTAGNILYKQQQYEKAYNKYTQGIEYCKYNKALKSILLYNRA